MARANVLLLVTGGIAAYKSCLLTRLLTQAGFSVRTAMTGSAQRFIGPVTLRALSGHGVATDIWGEGDTDPLDHVELSRWADIAVVAPATGNTLAKMANGIADDIVSTLLLAYEGPLVVAPAMNDVMWRHPATRSNTELLRERGAIFAEPGEGWLACGVQAEGRMAEPEDIFAAIGVAYDLIDPSAGYVDGDDDEAPFLRGHKVLVTAGPTYEPIDAIRFVGNRSTGAFGYALAAAAVRHGAEVTLIHGPSHLPVPPGVARSFAVETAAEMATAVAAGIQNGSRCLIMAAAVADFSPVDVASGKMKKESIGTSWNLEMTRTVDILADIVKPELSPGFTVIGFALETENMIERATEKMAAKGMDFIVANDPTAEDGAFGVGMHRVVLIGSDGVIWDSGPADKSTLAEGILDHLAPRFAEVSRGEVDE